MTRIVRISPTTTPTKTSTLNPRPEYPPETFRYIFATVALNVDINRITGEMFRLLSRGKSTGDENGLLGRSSSSPISNHNRRNPRLT